MSTTGPHQRHPKNNDPTLKLLRTKHYSLSMLLENSCITRKIVEKGVYPSIAPARKATVRK
ncbi:hypothetical protein K491DRAFT_698911 [Lophiostoma macrostomum CBS 122681]|uniref:Uncharacterized protein n=1 Tax=Lophiostoma macrostomum CBS 122681 TaxID=1314788 RepID=A0A6A6SL31_9PLEO|nr:hypothetical protein K491DRAFT_698911 [Lophiostoma macrostomum CBS 122681]